METIEVDLFDYQKASAPNILTSGGLGPCIAVGAICKEKGYLVHYLGYGTLPLELDQMLNDFEDLDKSQIKIYVAGAGFDSTANKETNEGIADGRRICLERITTAGFHKNIKKVQWNKEDHIQELILDLTTGNAEYEDAPLSDYVNRY